MRDISLKTAFADTVIHCGKCSFNNYVARHSDGQYFIVTDANVFAYYRYLMWKSFGDMVPVYILPAGETGKTMRYLTAILKEMVAKGMRRNCTLIGFGGGMVGDIAGLAASLYMRGVKFVQIPTTLLAQVDSAVGGKTAIDFEGIKNIVGSFYQPEQVIVDPNFLKTLPDREFRCGIGEIIKYAALDEQIFNYVSKNMTKLRSPSFIGEITILCIEHKAKIVEEDERDTKGLRKTLNLGHTTAHALELTYRKRSHGEYVMIGMYYENYIAQKLNVCSPEYAAELNNLILAIIKKIPFYDDIGEACELAKLDKKNDSREISLILPESKGKCREVKLPFPRYRELLEECSQTLKEHK